MLLYNSSWTWTRLCSSSLKVQNSSRGALEVHCCSNWVFFCDAIHGLYPFLAAPVFKVIGGFIVYHHRFCQQLQFLVLLAECHSEIQFLSKPICISQPPHWALIIGDTMLMDQVLSKTFRLETWQQMPRMEQKAHYSLFRREISTVVWCALFTEFRIHIHMMWREGIITVL